MTSCFVIAEAGVNHNGSVERALEMVRVAAAAGADAVKFQTFHAAQIVAAAAPQAAYQIRNTGVAESQLEMIRRLELDEAAHRLLADEARRLGIEFMSTAFDADSLHLLVELGLQRIKIPSGELTNLDLIYEWSKSGLPVIISTGMGTLDEIGTALAVSAWSLAGRDLEGFSLAEMNQFAHSDAGSRLLRARVTVLQCTTEYPAAVETANLRVLQTIQSRFPVKVGYSDHTMGTETALAAVALGATVVEKHFTLSRSLPGPDHAASLEPAELERMVRGIRTVESSLGSGVKAPSEIELENRLVARRSLVASRAIDAGELFTRGNLTSKRPGTGVPANHYWSYLGKRSPRRYAADTLIDAIEGVVG